MRSSGSNPFLNLLDDGMVRRSMLSQESVPSLNVKDAGYQGIGFTCGGFIHQTSKNEIDIFLHGWIRRISAFTYASY